MIFSNIKIRIFDNNQNEKIFEGIDGYLRESFCVRNLKIFK